MSPVVIGNATLYLGDCLEILPTLPKVDAVITDPPYNVGKDYGTHDDEMDPSLYLTFLSSRLYSLDTNSLIYTPGLRHFWDTPEVLRIAGFQLERILGWHKKEFAGDKFNAGPAMCWEPVIWAHRGTKTWNKVFGTQGRDFLVVNSTHGNPMAEVHPCPKPIEVMRWLVGMCAQSSVLDPFIGTGTTAVAAIERGMEFIGIEIEPKYFDIACERIENAQRQTRLFA